MKKRKRKTHMEPTPTLIDIPCRKHGCIALATLSGTGLCAAHESEGRMPNAVAYLKWVYTKPLDEKAAHKIPTPWE